MTPKSKINRPLDFLIPESIPSNRNRIAPKFNINFSQSKFNDFCPSFLPAPELNNFISGSKNFPNPLFFFLTLFFPHPFRLSSRFPPTRLHRKEVAVFACDHNQLPNCVFKSVFKVTVLLLFSYFFFSSQSMIVICVLVNFRLFFFFLSALLQWHNFPRGWWKMKNAGWIDCSRLTRWFLSAYLRLTGGKIVCKSLSYVREAWNDGKSRFNLIKLYFREDDAITAWWSR